MRRLRERRQNPAAYRSDPTLVAKRLHADILNELKGANLQLPEREGYEWPAGLADAYRKHQMITGQIQALQTVVAGLEGQLMSTEQSIHSCLKRLTQLKYHREDGGKVVGVADVALPDFEGRHFEGRHFEGRPYDAWADGTHDMALPEGAYVNKAKAKAKG